MAKKSLTETTICIVHPNFTVSRTAIAFINLGSRNGYAPQRLGLSTGEAVHSFQRQVEPIPCLITDINGGDVFGGVDRRAGVGDFPARPTVCRVPARDLGRTSNVREIGNRAESGVATRLQAIGAVRGYKM